MSFVLLAFMLLWGYSSMPAFREYGFVGRPKSIVRGYIIVAFVISSK